MSRPAYEIAVTTDLAACYTIRYAVFVREQGVPVALEQDAHDATATHLLAIQGRRAVGTARILFKDGTAKIGRVAVLAEARGAGLGKALIETALDVARAKAGIRRAQLGAQTHAIGFYEALGFSAYGPEYDDAGLPHRDMERALDP